MYDLNDTIAAVSSPSGDRRVIVRIAGPKAANIVHHVTEIKPQKAGIYPCRLKVEETFSVNCLTYMFCKPASYTGEDIAELHFESNSDITQQVMKNLFDLGCRMAGPGEFTARAYLNGKLDLTQAEAVGQIITGSNNYQLSAAEKLLSGKLSGFVTQIRQDIIEMLAFIEADMDFVEEDIDFLSTDQKIEKASAILEKLTAVLDQSLNYETVIGLPSVGLAGTSNAGKSSLLNTLAQINRSIVSDQQKTTRDILSHELSLDQNRCVIFDCAGLLINPDTILDKLAQQAAVEAIKNSCLTVFCIDLTKSEYHEDKQILNLIDSENIILVGTKSDLLTPSQLNQKVTLLSSVFDDEIHPLSSITKHGIDGFKTLIDERITSIITGSSKTGENLQDKIGINARHKNTIEDARENVTEALDFLSGENDELAAVVLRSAYESLSSLEQEKVDETVLDNIFGRFCIGK